MTTHAAYIDFDEAAAPATPAANRTRIYVKSDGKLYQKDDAGTETDLAATGSAPDCKIAYASSDTTTGAGANTLIDLAGCSLSLDAGTWLVTGFTQAEDSNASTTFIGLSIHDGTTSAATTATTKPSGSNERCFVSVQARITLASTTTVKLQGVSTRTTSTYRRSVAGVFGVGAANTATGITAIKVTPA